MAESKGSTIGAGKVVSLEYTLRDEGGEELERSEPGEPLVYLHGAQNIVPGLEEALDGKIVGDKVRVTLPPEKGYGEHDERGVHEVTADMFPEDAVLEVGAQFLTEDDDGEPMPFWVANIDGDSVTIDLNHPLAGVTLDFDVTVTEIRDATSDELKEGMADVEDDLYDVE